MNRRQRRMQQFRPGYAADLYARALANNNRKTAEATMTVSVPTLRRNGSTNQRKTVIFKTTEQEK